jgi:hypothetical protein
MPTAFIGNRHAIFIELRIIELISRFFELQALVLSTEAPPSINLFWGGGQIESPDQKIAPGLFFSSCMH